MVVETVQDDDLFEIWIIFESDSDDETVSEASPSKLKITDMGDVKVLYLDVGEEVDSKHVLFEVEFSTLIDVDEVELVTDDFYFSSIIVTDTCEVEYFDSTTWLSWLIV